MAIINFLCPKCHTLLSVNTLSGDRVACEQCFESFVVQPDEIKFVVLRLVSED